jgi:peptidoglycan LD-endopeptidase CwlK
MINSRNIDDLHPTLKRGVEEFDKRMKALNYSVLITATFRDNDYQNSLYAQGRTKPGSIVTNAKGGQSMHNYRLAFDVCKNIRGEEFSDIKFFETAGRVWTEMGGEWGGSWVGFSDRPHMQFTNGVKDSEIFNGKKLDQNAKMKWENIIIKEPVIKEPPKEDNYMVTKLDLIKNGKSITTNNIFFNDKNYVELRDYEESYGNVVSYDAKTNKIEINDSK